MKNPLLRGMRRLSICLATVLACSTTPSAAQAQPIPAALEQTLPGAQLAGEGVLSFLGLRIYDARLWVSTDFDPGRYLRRPLALELTYQRAFDSVDIARRSMTEIKRQGPVSASQAQRWEAALQALIPDVKKGDQLIGLYVPEQGLALWQGQNLLGRIDDPVLAQRFIGIWLSEHTSEPDLRQALITGAAERSP